MGLQQVQRPGADAAAPQVAAHGKVIHQPGLLPRQYHLPGVGQHGPGVIGKGQRFIQAGGQQFFHRRKGLQLPRRKVPRHAALIQLPGPGSIQQTNSHIRTPF